MRKSLIMAAGISALMTAPALAGGTVEPAPAPATIVPVAPVGVDWTGPSVGVQLGYADVETSGAASVDGDDLLYGLRAYYDYDFGNFILGGGLQYDATDIDLGGVTTLDSVLRAGLRAGIDFNRTWAYGTVGLARAETSGGGVGDSDGYFAGVGFETLLTDQISLGGELLYHEFDDFDLDGLDAEATTAAVSVNFRF